MLYGLVGKYGTGGYILPVLIEGRTDMISRYRFEVIEGLNCFEDGVNNILYFPITDSEDFPREIREKAEEIIDGIIHAYELEKNCKLDLLKLCLNARIIVFIDRDGNWTKEISVLVSDSTGYDDIWIEESYSVDTSDPLYEPFKIYFMKQLEERLFGVDS